MFPHHHHPRAPEDFSCLEHLLRFRKPELSPRSAGILEEQPRRAALTRRSTCEWEDFRQRGGPRKPS